MLKATDQAEELITWLRRRTRILARIRDWQAAHGKPQRTVLRAVLTRWTSHFQAITRLLQLQNVLNAILADEKASGVVSVFLAGLRSTKEKAHAQRMIELIESGPFWHSLTR